MSDDEDAKNVEEHDFESLERDFQQVRLPRRARAGAAPRRRRPAAGRPIRKIFTSTNFFAHFHRGPL